MACRLCDAKPLSKLMRVIIDWTLRNKLQWNFNQNTKLFIDENASKSIVCEMTAILSWGRWIDLIAVLSWQHYLATTYALHSPYTLKTTANFRPRPDVGLTKQICPIHYHFFLKSKISLTETFNEVRFCSSHPWHKSWHWIRFKHIFNVHLWLCASL